MENKTPAVIYSGGKDAVAVQLDTSDLFRKLLFIQGRNAVISLSINGDEQEKRHVVVREIQKDPVTEQPVHMDFFEIALDQATEFVVPLNLAGTAKGVDLGGYLTVFKKKVRVKGCPLDIPDSFEADITSLDRGDAGLKLADLALPENCEMLENGEMVFVSVS